MVFILCWSTLLLAYVLNAIWYWQYSNRMHKVCQPCYSFSVPSLGPSPCLPVSFPVSCLLSSLGLPSRLCPQSMFFPACVGLVLSVLDQAHWQILSREGGLSTTMPCDHVDLRTSVATGVADVSIADARSLFGIAETTIFFMVTMALADGYVRVAQCLLASASCHDCTSWGVVQPNMDSTTAVNVIGQRPLPACPIPLSLPLATPFFSPLCLQACPCSSLASVP